MGSGTVTKEIRGLPTASDEETLVERYVEPPLEYGYFLDANPTIPAVHIQTPIALAREPVEKKAKQAVVVKLNHVLWAACKDYQSSTETRIDGVWRGVFTYFFCKALRRAGVVITRRRLDCLVSADISKKYNQIPQLEGTKESIDQKVFT